MPLFKINQKTILFIHIPKTGGTSVEEAFQAAGPKALFSDRRPVGLRCTPQHFHGDLLSAVMQREFVDYSFAVVRHPVDRLVSEFFYRCKDLKFRYYAGFRRRKVRISEASPAELTRAFSGWLDRILADYSTNPFILDNHIRPQAEFTSQFDPVVFRFEDGLQSALDTIGAKIGHAFGPVPHANASNRPRFPIAQADLLKLKTFYASDFETFGYALDA
ncbi:sulfotransferase family 2 domain-containing protein [Roseibium aggregatum]|uniref:Sulfotransferase family 2 domain-containing protein n=1 Tax=Roseibium aggregatum TaxID=187304 RepID=A0A939IY93_9HYPH|nr:sulfotransferase family 2 domain-containing protein [Roseibium aggregatum]MBN9668726.1 sulfotransferase family 2 domain-containing protein [Roseibium aggregatum]